MTDIYDIIESCKKNLQDAQEDLYHRFADIMFGVCLRYSRNKTEAEDNFQDAFITVFEKIKTFKHRGSFEGWMRRVFINTIFKNYKKNKMLLFDERYELVDSNSPDIEVSSDIPLEKLLDFVQELSPQYRLIFNMYALDKYTHREISEITGISIGTSKSNYARARMVLQKKINNYRHQKSIAG